MRNRATAHWRARPLVSHETVVNLIANTTTSTGLRVKAKLDRRSYQTGKKVSKAVMRGLNIACDAFHGEWNDMLSPRGNHAPHELPSFPPTA